MSSTVGAFEAKTHLSALLDRVAGGETITITKHGIPAAVLAPVERAQRTSGKGGYAEIVRELRVLRQRVKPGRMTVRQMVEEGRRR